NPESTLSEVVDLMDIYQVNALPVVDTEGRLCGMITEHDVLRAMLPQGRESLAGRKGLASDAGDARTADWMTAPAVFVQEDSDANTAAALLLRTGFKRLPVVGFEGKVVGTLNRIDVFQAYFEGSLHGDSTTCP